MKPTPLGKGVWWGHGRPPPKLHPGDAVQEVPVHKATLFTCKSLFLFLGSRRKAFRDLSFRPPRVTAGGSPRLGVYRARVCRRQVFIFFVSHHQANFRHTSPEFLFVNVIFLLLRFAFRNVKSLFSPCPMRNFCFKIEPFRHHYFPLLATAGGS